eukprot:364487-Chlamydomonas_euryale.AAC.22
MFCRHYCAGHVVADGMAVRARACVLTQVVKALDAKEIVFDGESRRRLQIGINKVADAVGVTLGPRGGCADRNWRYLRGYAALGERGGGPSRPASDRDDDTLTHPA